MDKSFHDVPPAELLKVCALPELTIIDQRDAATRAQGALQDSVAASDELISDLLRRRKSDPAVLVYCYHGNQSRELCSFLSQFGLKRVFNLAGGWAAWQAWQIESKQQVNTCAAWLQDRGFDPKDLNARVANGMSALMQASLEGNTELMGQLLALGANPNHRNDDEHNALWFACVSGEAGAVQLLIEAGAQLDNRNVNGVTAAVYAASTGKLGVLQQLVQAGADLNIRTNDGYDALDSASTLPVLRYLKPLCASLSEA